MSRPSRRARRLSDLGSIALAVVLYPVAAIGLACWPWVCLVEWLREGRDEEGRR